MSRRNNAYVVVAALTSSLACYDTVADRITGPTHTGTIAVDVDGARLWSVNPDHDTVTAVDARRLVRLFERPVGDNPRTLAIAPDGAIWVVNQDDATISVLSGKTGETRHTVDLPYASRPYGIAFAPASNTAFVTLQAVGRIVRIDTKTNAVTGIVDVGPTPRGMAITADGQRVLVTRWISPATHGEVTEVSADSLTVLRRFTLAADPGPDTGLSGRGVPNHLAAITITPDGKRAWIPSKKDNTGRGLTVSGEPLNFENTVRAIVSQVDLVANGEVLSARRDFDNRAMPVAVAFDAEARHAFVALQGSNAVDVLNAVDGSLAASFDTGLTPQGLVVDADGRLFVQNYLSRTVAVYDVSGLSRGEPVRRIGRIPTTEHEPLPPDVLLGKRVFYNAADPRMSRDGYVSCASCHLEGGSDGRTWDFSGRGAHGGGLRNTITMHGRAGLRHGPIHWRADMDEIQDFEILLRTTLQGRGFVSDEVFLAKGPDWVFGEPNRGLSRELDALAAYGSSFEAVHPSPYRLPGGEMTPDAVVGEAIFHSEETGCATCHVPPRFTDSSLEHDDKRESSALPFLMHDVGTLSATVGDFRPNTVRALDTPTVKGVWQTPPYLHDGSAATLMDVITTRNPDDRHGKTSHLTMTERRQLVAYLRELDDS
ncbi:MAG: hypothetical protein OXH15_16360 [Gammaproteobacteria bacterium]|nr:hypothetical protein [Gammaproteobacteria bacterium]